MNQVANDIWIVSELVTRGGLGSGPHFLIRPSRTSGYREVAKCSLLRMAGLVTPDVASSSARVPRETDWRIDKDRTESGIVSP
jgi:hypothetical protein